MSAKVAPAPEDDSDFQESESPNTPHATQEPENLRRTQPRGQSGLWNIADIESIKEKVREKRQQPEPYSVYDYYWKTGICQAIAKHWLFENFTLGVICVNAIWIWIDTDYNNAESIDKADAIFKVMDSLFFIYFFCELLVRFLAFESKVNCFRDFWFVFDFILVALYMFDPFILGIVAMTSSGGGGFNPPTELLRLCRLARLSRLVRMLRSFPELMIFIKGMIRAIGTVGYTLVMLIVINYIFSVAIVNLVDPESEIAGEPFDGGFFSGVMEASLSLFVYATFLDNLADFLYAVMYGDLIVWFVSWVYIILAALTVMNMLIGVLCTVIDSVAAEERESMVVDKVYDKFHKIMERPEFSDGRLTWAEFQKLMESPEVLEALDAVSTDPEALVDIAEDAFWDDGVELELDFDQLMAMILDLRGGEAVTISSMFKMVKHSQQKFDRVHCRMDVFEKKLDSLLTAVDGRVWPDEKTRDAEEATETTEDVEQWC